MYIYHSAGLFNLLSIRPDGPTFSVTKSNVKLKILPEKGDIVSFSYDNYSRRSLPINPKVYRLRHDMTWDYLVKSHLDSIAEPQKLNCMTPTYPLFSYFSNSFIAISCAFYFASLTALDFQ